MNPYGPFFTETELGLDQLGVTKQDREKAFLLVKFGLNPIRQKYGPVKITSGWRSKLHNAQVGGIDGSQHCDGEAVDFTLPTQNGNRPCFEWLRTWWSGQCFYYLRKGHIHIAVPRIDLAVAGRLYGTVLDK